MTKNFQNYIQCLAFLQVTPIVSQLSCFGAKIATSFNPVILVLNHPKFREVLSRKVRCITVKPKERGEGTENDNLAI